MLIDFFFTLKDAKIPVSIKEFLTLLEALQKNVIDTSLDDFYYLAPATTPSGSATPTRWRSGPGWRSGSTPTNTTA